MHIGTHTVPAASQSGRFGLRPVRVLRCLATVMCCGAIGGFATAPAAADDDLQTEDAEKIEFFESRIRPVLVQHCYECHSADAETMQASLYLDSAAGMRAGGDSGELLAPGHPADSLLISALRYESFEMPPTAQLPESVIRDFETWVRDGAVDPRDNSSAVLPRAAVDVETGRSFWAFQPPQLSTRIRALEEQQQRIIRDTERVDMLVEQRLTERGIVANAAGDPRTLFRRLSFDLTGLPPSPEVIATLLRDDSDDVLPQYVDQLLASPAYGEHLARMWLDVARYAEDQAHIVGNNKSLFYPNAWKYRDWIIHAFNSDMPYDDFVRMQLAADVIAPEDQASHVALGLIGLGPKYYRRGSPEVMADEWEDRVDIVGRGLLGITVACARCHDHKYDPIRTEDYYGLAGIFASTQMYNRPLSDGLERDKSGAAKNPEESIHIVRDGKVQDLAVMIRGNVEQRGEVVPRGFPAILFEGQRREFNDGSGRRELAESIVDPSNPLTARVIVNRVWQHLFGRGLVATPSNFGRLGEPPTHPQLLDDLAVRFMDNGWSLKWLQRQIVLSRAWQRSSIVSEQALAADPGNEFLWRMPRRRLSVEAWRDAVMTAAGVLDAEVGGASVAVDDVAATRRTVYAEVSRMELNPMLARFDFPDPNVHAARRAETNTPLQKLFLMNSDFMLRMSDALADRAIEFTELKSGQIHFLFQTAYQRDPDSEELRLAEAFLTENPDDGLSQLAQSLLISNEFWFLD